MNGELVVDADPFWEDHQRAQSVLIEAPLSKQFRGSFALLFVLPLEPNRVYRGAYVLLYETLEASVPLANRRKRGDRAEDPEIERGRVVRDVNLPGLVRKRLPVHSDDGSEREHQRLGNCLKQDQQHALTSLAIDRTQQLNRHNERAENDNRSHEPNHPQREQNPPSNDHPDHVEYIKKRRVVIGDSLRRFETLREGIRNQGLREVSHESCDYFRLRLGVNALRFDQRVLHVFLDFR